MLTIIITIIASYGRQMKDAPGRLVMLVFCYINQHVSVSVSECVRVCTCVGVCVVVCVCVCCRRYFFNNFFTQREKLSFLLSLFRLLRLRVCETVCVCVCVCLGSFTPSADASGTAVKTAAITAVSDAAQVR